MTKKTLIRLIGTATCVAVMAGGWDAEAGWRRRHHGSSGGSWGSSGGSSGGSWGSYGSNGGSSGGSWGSNGSSGGSSSYSSHGSSGGSYGSSGGSHGSSGGGYVVYHRHPVVVHHHAPAYEEVIVNEVVKTTPADTATIVVELPKDAKVFINGAETKATGSTRQFVSKGLKEGASYQYEVRIVTGDKDSPMEQTKVLKLARGQRKTVTFDAATATAVKPVPPKPDSVAATNGT